ncbi:uncharacterized protein LOC117206693 [Bombus bifarius]|uniref:Uncharacterized protein LOC117206693 n=1 Tax=Bombus bifarius TaxID=103933 RepID=A0A6P8LUX1_9HYME|nr:uncharacterized protein LOC117157706 [Bombus vancouverensis nearcticus]XP_033302134.1 uncharacterized protein LOC117206693 [Bombus bifarius]
MAPLRSMQPTARGSPQVPSSGLLRPFTPPDLSSIPHMDGTPPQNSGVRNSSSSVSGQTNDGAQQQSGPYIIGSPIDLGNIDNVDNIGLRIDSLTTGIESRRTREHIELQEAGVHERSSEARTDCPIKYNISSAELPSVHPSGNVLGL